MVVISRGERGTPEDDGSGPPGAGQGRVAPGNDTLLRIQLLGGFRAFIGPRSIEDSEWYLRKAKHLVKLLATAPERRLHRGELMDILWPELDVDAGTNNLHKVLHIARRVLEPDLPAKTPSAYLRMQGEFVSLAASDTVWIDIEAFREAAERARLTNRIEAYEEALDLYRGDLLPEDRYDDWAIRRRDSLRTVRFRALIEAANLYEQRGDRDEAMQALQQVVESDPAHEEAQMHLIRLLATSGQRQTALRQYQQLCEALLEELHMEPSAAARQLYEQLLTDGATVPPQAPAGGESAGTSGDLLIGRDAALAQLEGEIDRLFTGHGNLVVTVGENGIGKSRLVTETLRRAEARGAITLWASAYRARQDQPYHLFSILMDGFALRIPPETLRGLVGASGTILAGLSPNLAHVLELDGEEGPAAFRDSPLIASAMVDFFGQLTRFAPVTLMLDDLHFADDVSLMLLQDLAGLLEDMPVLVLATYRDAEMVPGSALERLHDTCGDVSPRLLRLDRISRAETGRLAAVVLSGDVDSAVVETIYGMASGNLHYTLEAIQALQGRRRIVQTQGKWRLRSGIAVTWNREQLRGRPESGDFRLSRLIRT